MKFSVTIPAYKAQYLQEAIESVVSQTYTDWELIIVDDCSPEDLQSIVNPFLDDKRILYYRNKKNCGALNVVDNWNICLGYCTGDYVVCMGDDDRLLPCCLEEYKKLIEKHPALNVYHARTEIINEEGEVTELLVERPELEDALTMIRARWNGRKQFIGDYCYRRQYLKSCGGYHFMPLAWGSDDITALKAAETTGIANSNAVGFQYRENNHSISLSSHEKEKALAVLLQREWYIDVLQKLDNNIATKQEIHQAKSDMLRFTENLLMHHITNDIRNQGLNRYIYWCNLISKHHISLLKPTKILLKVLLQNVLNK